METGTFVETIARVNAAIEVRPYDAGAYDDLLSLYKAEIDACEAPADGLSEEAMEDRAIASWQWHESNSALRDRIVDVTRTLVDAGLYRETERFNILYRRSLLMDAKVDFDAFMLYVESDREPARRFWLPRRGILKPVADAMTELIDGDQRLLGISLPPGTGKTTLAIFLLAWIGGRWPDEYSVVFSHDGDILKGMYNEILRIISADGEYLWRDVFPDVPLVSTNAKDMRIDLGHGSRFETVQFASIGSENAGKVRASKLLYCDDLVGSIEQAMSKERLDKLWTQYTTDIQQRGTGDWRELHIATRWSVWDVIGRLERAEQDSPTGRARFIAVPAVNEKDESNFDYPGIENKFTTERYRRLRESMDDVNWRALYMNQPIEREGQLYNEEELRRFFELPQGEPDAIIAVCDTKAKGSDFCVLPVAVRYGEDYYIDGAVCDNSPATEVLEHKMAILLTEKRVQMCQFESNSAGWSVAEQVQKRVRSIGGRCSISTKPTTQNKETKIIVNAPWVKQHCLFRDRSTYSRNSDYGRFMEQLMIYTVAGRNAHDDVPDAMAMLALYAQSFEAVKVVAFQRPY